MAGMFLRAGTVVSWPWATVAQFGLDPRWSVRVGRLDAAERQWVRSLAAGYVADKHSRLVPLLRRAGVLVDEIPTDRAGAALMWSQVAEHGRGDLLLAGRERACVEVDHLGLTGAALCAALADAGVGVLTSPDAATVRAQDTAGTWLRGQAGRTRREAVAAQLPRGLAAPTTEPDVLVHITGFAVDPARAVHLLNSGIAHLPIVFSDTAVTVGPMVRPGVSACLVCLDHHRCARDPRWPYVVADIAGQDWLEEPGLAWWAAAAASALIVAAVDERERSGVSLTWSLDDPLPQVGVWEPHPRCGCHQL